MAGDASSSSVDYHLLKPPADAGHIANAETQNPNGDHPTGPSIGGGGGMEAAAAKFQQALMKRDSSISGKGKSMAKTVPLKKAPSTLMRAERVKSNMRIKAAKARSTSFDRSPSSDAGSETRRGTSRSPMSS